MTTTNPTAQSEMTWQEMLRDARTADALDRVLAELNSIESELQEAKSEIEASFDKTMAIAAEALAKYTLL